MTESDVVQYLQQSYEGLVIAGGEGNTFVMYDPGRQLPESKRFPFITVMTNDLNDRASNLDRPGAFRVNIEVRKQTFDGLFGDVAFPDEPFSAPAGFDYKEFNVLMPHPVYGRQHWVCILNPDEHKWEQTLPLIAEAYDRAKARHAVLTKAPAAM